MGFHENLIQTFQNFKDKFIGSNDISGLGDGTLSGAILDVDSNKQDTLTFDNVPTSSSTNPVTSGGVYTALQNVHIDVDNALDSTSENPVQNKVIKAVIDSKQDTLTAGTRITMTGSTISADSEIDDTATTNSVTWSAAKIIAYMASFSSLHFEIVTTLPSTNISTSTIYLVLKSTSETSNIYTEYYYINNNWEIIGDTSVDLTNYYTQTQVDTLLLGKEDTLTFDSTPTSGSNNPVTSGGVYSALQNVDIDVDNTLDSTSENPVQNKVITSALDSKQNTLTAGDNITIETIGNSTVISGTGGGSVYWQEIYS